MRNSIVSLNGVRLSSCKDDWWHWRLRPVRDGCSFWWWLFVNKKFENKKFREKSLEKKTKKKSEKLTSSITEQMWYIHLDMDSAFPPNVTARSVEFGNISLATWMVAPEISRISLILDPPLPINEPHWEAGTINRKVTGALAFWPCPFCGYQKKSKKKKEFKTFFQSKSISKVTHFVVELFELASNEQESRQNGVSVAGYGHNTLRTNAIWNADSGFALFSNFFNVITFFADNTSYFLLEKTLEEKGKRETNCY